MMKFSFFLFLILSSHVLKATGTCLSTQDMNQNRSLYSRGDLSFFNDSGVASERLCFHQRQRAFGECMSEAIREGMNSQLNVCDQSSSEAENILKEMRAKCGAEVFEKRLPDCPSQEYSFPSCQQFSGYVDPAQTNQCVFGNIAPGIGTLDSLADEMTREERSRQVLNSLRDNMVKSFEEGLEPLTQFKTCLQNKISGGEEKTISFNGQNVECSKITEYLMAKVMMTLPVLRQHQILSQGPALRSRDEDLRPFKREVQNRFPGTELSDEEIRKIGENIRPERMDLPIGNSPEATLEEVQLASEIRQREFAHRDQQFLEAYQDKEPFKDCVIKQGEGEEQSLRFISTQDDQVQALKCGIMSARDENKIVNTVLTRADELNMEGTDSMRAHDAFLSYRIKAKDEHEDAVKGIVEENPFLAHMNLSTNDLPTEDDSEEVQGQKERRVLQSLLNSFSHMEGVSRRELNNVKNENDLGELRSLAMKNPDFVEQAIVNQPNLDKRTCDVLESLKNSQRVSDRTSSALRMTASIVGGLTCPFTWGAGCLLAAAAQIPHVRDLNQRKNHALGEFFTGQASLEDYLTLEQEHSSAKLLMGLELIGMPMVGSGKLLLRSAREMMSVSRSASRGGALAENIPRVSFGRDVGRAVQASTAQGNVEVFTVHGMASSHAAIRIGDTVYHTGQGFGKSIGSNIAGAKGDFVSEPFEEFLKRETRGRRAVEGMTINVPDAELATLRANAERFSGQSYSLMKSNCSQTVCDIVTHSGPRTIDVERTFDPLVLRQRFNDAIGDRAVSQNIYGNSAALGSSSRRRFLLLNSIYAVGYVYGEAFDFIPE